MEGQSQDDIRTNFIRTYFVTNETDDVDMNEVNMTLRRFWETDNSGIDDNQVLSIEDNLILNKAHQSIKFVGGHYRVAIPLERGKGLIVEQLLNGTTSIAEFGDAFRKDS